MTKKRDRFNNSTSNKFLFRKRTLEGKNTQDFRINSRQMWHIGNGEYYIYKW